MFTKYTREVTGRIPLEGVSRIVLFFNIPTDGYVHKTFLFERGDADAYTRRFRVYGRLSDNENFDEWTLISTTDVSAADVTRFYVNNDYYSFIRVTVTSLVNEGIGLARVTLSMRE